jgi:hypothetical protein
MLVLSLVKLSRRASTRCGFEPVSAEAQSISGRSCSQISDIENWQFKPIHFACSAGGDELLRCVERRARLAVAFALGGSSRGWDIIDAMRPWISVAALRVGTAKSVGRSEEVSQRDSATGCSSHAF